MGGTLPIDAVRRQLTADLDALVEAVVTRTGEEAPGLRTTATPALAAAFRASARQAVVAVVAATTGGATTTGAATATTAAGRAAPAVSPDVAAEAEVLAGAGVPLADVLRPHRIAQAVVLERALEHGEAGDRHALVGAALRFGDDVATVASAAHARALDRAARARAAAVADVLAGRDADLAHPLEAVQVGLVADGERAEAAVAAVAAALGGRLLTVPGPDAAAVHGWLALEAAPAAADLRRLRVPAGARLAVGRPAPGAGGFRATHAQALDAHRVAVRRDDPLTLHEDWALPGLLLRDEAAARAFALEALGPLAGPGRRAATLRATLAAWVAAGGSAPAAARASGVAERTVTYRLRAAEQRLGRRLTERRAELEAAVALHALLER